MFNGIFFLSVISAVSFQIWLCVPHKQNTAEADVLLTVYNFHSKEFLLNSDNVATSVS